MRTNSFFKGILLCLGLICAASGNAARAESTDADFSRTGFLLREQTVFSPVFGEAANSFTRLAGSELAILGSREDLRLGKLLHIGLDVEENENLPSDFWIRESDLAADALEPYAPADSHEGEFAVLKAMTYCYRYVKEYLIQTGKVKGYIPGGSAYMAAGILPKYGFVRTGHSPANASEGEVCVYSGGPQGHGHIEVKRNGGWWYGYGIKNHPITNRHFLGCFYK